MNFLLFFKVVFFPVLLPLSVFYGFCAFLYKVFTSVKPYRAKSKIISVGNFCVGGSGKTPLILLLAQNLKEKGFSPLVITKSYKASLTKPCEVLKGSDPLIFGDEAVSLKEMLDGVVVVSGPSKSEAVKYSDLSFKDDAKRIYLLDDGAQHHKVYKDIKIHVWDMTRGFLDLFPFPLGLSREFWFMGERPSFSVLNRFSKEKLIPRLVKGAKIKASYSVKSIKNSFSKEELSSDFTLISGLGNFKQLKDSVESFVSEKPFKMKSFIKGVDHDEFSWFKPEPDVVYVCTHKDKAKLVDRISEESLYIVESDYNKDFKKDLSKSLDEALKGVLK